MSLALTPIVNPSATGNWGNSQQGGWIYGGQHCGVVPPDYNQTYMCVGSSNVTSAVTTYEAIEIFHPCCMRTAVMTDTQKSYPDVYFRAECYSLYCYTSDEQQALEWPACINQRMKAYAEGADLPEGNRSALSSPYSTWGTCELINYDRLEKKLKFSAATSHHVGSWSVVVGGLLVTAAMQLL